VLRLGDLQVLHADDQYLQFERTFGGETLLCGFNLSPDWVTQPMPDSARRIETVGIVETDGLGPYAGFVAGKGA